MMFFCFIIFRRPLKSRAAFKNSGLSFQQETAWAEEQCEGPL
jgi:hypothetical protein